MAACVRSRCAGRAFLPAGRNPGGPRVRGRRRRRARERARRPRRAVGRGARAHADLAGSRGLPVGGRSGEAVSCGSSVAPGARPRRSTSRRWPPCGGSRATRGPFASRRWSAARPGSARSRVIPAGRVASGAALILALTIDPAAARSRRAHAAGTATRPTTAARDGRRTAGRRPTAADVASLRARVFGRRRRPLAPGCVGGAAWPWAPGARTWPGSLRPGERSSGAG